MAERRRVPADPRSLPEREPTQSSALGENRMPVPPMRPTRRPEDESKYEGQRYTPAVPPQRQTRGLGFSEPADNVQPKPQDNGDPIAELKAAVEGSDGTDGGIFDALEGWREKMRARGVKDEDIERIEQEVYPDDGPDYVDPNYSDLNQ